MSTSISAGVGNLPCFPTFLSMIPNQTFFLILVDIHLHIYTSTQKKLEFSTTVGTIAHQ